MSIRKINQLEFKRLCLVRQNYHYLLFDHTFKSVIATEEDELKTIVDDALHIVCVLSKRTLITECIETLTVLDIKGYEVIKVEDEASLAILDALSIKAVHNNIVEFYCRDGLLTALPIYAKDISKAVFEAKTIIGTILETIALNNNIEIKFNLPTAIDEAFSVLARLLILSSEMTAKHDEASATGIECYNSIFKPLFTAAIDYANSISSNAIEDIDINMEINLLLGRLATIADWGDNSLNDLSDSSLKELKVYIQGE